MNEPNYQDESITDSAMECSAEARESVLRNPLGAVIFAIGAGLLFAMLMRALRPEPTARERAAHIFEDLENRVRHATRPVMRKAGSLAADGADALHQKLRSGEAGFERLVRHGTHRLRHLFV